jgi:ornithine carbamoyltransferase
VGESLRGRSFLKELDWTAGELTALLDLAAELKRAKAEGEERKTLEGRNFALVFEKSSTRTRCSFEVAAHDQGANVTFIGPTGSHLGAEESLADTARFLGRLFHGIAYRGHEQTRVEELDAHAGVPVWNGLTDEWHPTQILADMLTMREMSGKPLEEISFCFLGDTRFNMARSLLVAGAILGMDARLCGPEALRPPDDVVETAHSLARASGARCRVLDDPASAVAGVDFVYTDVWLSMGEPAAGWTDRVSALRPYRVTSELMAASGNPDVRFLHCLPALHDRKTELGEKLYELTGLDGIEVTDEVFQSEASVVFDQAENRMHTIKALLVATAGA